MESDFSSPARKLQTRTASVRSASSESSQASPGQMHILNAKAKRKSIQERNQGSNLSKKNLNSIDEDEDGKLFFVFFDD